MNQELKLMEEEINKKTNKIRKIIIPTVNLFVIPLSYFSLHLLDSLNIVESIVLALMLLFVNVRVLNKISMKKELKLEDYVYKNILPEIFNKYFKEYELKKNEGLSIKDTKRSDLLSIKDSSIFEKEDYVKFTHNKLECEMSDIRNIVNSAEYSCGTVDCGVLIKIKSTKNNFKFVIRDVGKFDYDKEYFMEEKIDLYLTNNEEFEFITTKKN